MMSCILFVALLTALGSAIALGTNDDANAWGRASANEKRRWVADTVTQANASSRHKYTSASLSGCLDTMSKAAPPSKTTPVTLGTATALCLITIEERGSPRTPSTGPSRKA